MRPIVLMAAFALAATGLAACEQSKSEASEAVAPVAKKSLSRPAQMYAGQEPIQKVDTATVSVDASGGLDMSATGEAASAGYTHATFLPRINAAPPADGIYEVDVVAQKPGAASAAAAAPLQVKGGWTGYPKAHLKGVKFIAKDNSVTAMLPAA